MSRWIGIADVLFCLLVIGMMQTAAGGGMLDDPGLGWHLRNVDAMIDHGGWLTEDPFGPPDAHRPWRTNQWVGDGLLWLGERWAGLNGIAAVTVLILAVGFRLLFSMMIADGVAWPIAGLWTYLAALACSPSWVARPNVLTIVFTLLTARLCDRYLRDQCSLRRLAWLVPLLAVWANTHGGFIAGLIILTMAVAFETGRLLVGMGDGRRLRGLLLVAGGAGLATCLNPYGPGLYSWVFSLLGNRYFMQLNDDWLSPDFHQLGAVRYELLILLLPAVVGLSTRRGESFSLGLSLVWLHFALGGRRYVPLWVVVVAPLLARSSVCIPWLRKQWARLRLSPDLKSLLESGPASRSGRGSVAVGALLLLWARFSGEYAHHDPNFIPADALRHAIALAEGRPLLHEYGWGGFVINHGWRRSPPAVPYIDDRNEVYGQEHAERFFRLRSARGDWRQTLDDAQIAVVCLLPTAPLIEELSRFPAIWRLVQHDRYAILYERISTLPTPAKH